MAERRRAGGVAGQLVDHDQPPAALDARMQRESQMTFFEYMVLSVLSEEPDRTMQMSALAVRTSASLSRLSHVVGRWRSADCSHAHAFPEQADAPTRR